MWLFNKYTKKKTKAKEIELSNIAMRIEDDD